MKDTNSKRLKNDGKVTSTKVSDNRHEDWKDDWEGF